MNVTVEQLRRMILSEVDSDADGIPDSEEIVDAWTFAPTAEEEAKKINAQTGVHLITDPKHWAEYGIHTGEELAKTLLASSYSDTYKSIHGIRPRWVRTSEMSVQEIQKLLSDLEGESEEWMEDRFHDDQEGWKSDIEDERRDAQRAYDDSREAEIAAAAAEEEAMKIPEEGEDLPSFQGMGRRPDSGFKHGRHPPGRSSWMRGKLSESLTGLNKQYYGQGVQDIVQTLGKMRVTKSHLRKIIQEEIAHVVFDDIHEVPDDLEFLDPHEAYGLGHEAGMEHAAPEDLPYDLSPEPPTVEDAWYPSDVVPREDAWSGGDNLDDPLDHSYFETGERNAGPHVMIRERSRSKITLRQLRGMIREALLSEERLDEGECPEDGCIQKRGKGWVVISNKTGECWGRSKKDGGECTYYDSKSDAEDALKAYHA